MNQKSSDYVAATWAAARDLFAQNASDSGAMDVICRMANRIAVQFRTGGELLVAGNGGSFADALHLGGELEAQFEVPRCSLPVTVLGGNIASLTAWSNDYEYMTALARFFGGRAKKENALLLMSTSGNSKNLFPLIDVARRVGMPVFAFLGKAGGAMAQYSLDGVLIAPSDDTARIQELHKLWMHTLCGLLDREFAS